MEKETKKKLKINDVLPLNQKEIELIYYIRTRFQYGDIIIKTRDGSPYRIEQVVKYQTLDNK